MFSKRVTRTESDFTAKRREPVLGLDPRIKRLREMELDTLEGAGDLPD
jgi:hypothetical protein